MARIPVVRLQAENGALLVREGLSACFYLRRTHEDISRAVMRALEAYLQAVGHQVLGWYTDLQGDWWELDTEGWASVRREFERKSPHIYLSDTPSNASQYEFEYYGKSLDSPLFANDANVVCALCFKFPAEYLEKHGSTHVRNLILDLAEPLPFNSGHAGPAFNALMELAGVSAELRQWCVRYPGMDIPDLRNLSMSLGTRVRGAYWLTFLGQPVLGELGGTSGLRSRISAPDTSVQDMDGDRAVITLGPSPEPGDTQRGLDLPLHSEVARILEPWLYHRSVPWSGFTSIDMLRWERRFLDCPPGGRGARALTSPRR